jgi:hypothetical protein
MTFPDIKPVIPPNRSGHFDTHDPIKMTGFQEKICYKQHNPKGGENEKIKGTKSEKKGVLGKQT